MSDIKSRIESAIRRREELASSKARVLGRLEEAEKNLESVRSELLSKKVDPDRLTETVEKLETALSTSLQEFEAQLQQAEQMIAPFV